MKKVAVLGANGYIARNLVYILNRDYPEYEITLYGIEDKSVDGQENYIQVDMTNKSEISKISLDCDIIFMFVLYFGPYAKNI